MIFTNLLTNMVLVTILGQVPTNTPAFQRYARQAMLSNAQFVAAKWNLDQVLVASNKISEFDAKPYVSGLGGVIIFGNRYRFAYRRGNFVAFTDGAYSPDFLSFDQESKVNAAIRKWLRATNLLNALAARSIAQSALAATGMDPADIGSPKRGQEQFSEMLEGDTVLLPYYRFEWEATMSAEYSQRLGLTNSPRYPSVEIEVSGISGRIAHFEQNTPALKLPKPPNYLELLGLPANTLFVRSKFVPSGPPLYEALPP